MALPIFPTEDEVMRLILSELPDGTYAIDLANDPNPDNRSVSSSELRAHAALIGALYENMSGLWSDKFLSTLTPGGVSAWEKQLFTSAQDASAPFAARKANLIAKFRSSGGISYQALRDVVSGILSPLGLDFELSSWCGPHDGGFVLDEATLDIGTYISIIDPILGARADKSSLDCGLNSTAAGLSDSDMRDIQRVAYTYELRIFGVADAGTVSTLDALLSHLEPARSTHIILNNHRARVIAPVPAKEISWDLESGTLDVDSYLSLGSELEE